MDRIEAVDTGDWNLGQILAGGFDLGVGASKLIVEVILKGFAVGLHLRVGKGKVVGKAWAVVVFFCLVHDPKLERVGNVSPQGLEVAEVSRGQSLEEPMPILPCSEVTGDLLFP